MSELAMGEAVNFAGMPGSPSFDLTEASKTFPPLGGVAFPGAQDQRARLVTMAHIPARVDRVWRALVEPDQVRSWLGVCHGGWATRGAESTLDCEDGEFFYCRTDRVTPPAGTRPG